MVGGMLVREGSKCRRSVGLACRGEEVWERERGDDRGEGERVGGGGEMYGGEREKGVGGGGERERERESCIMFFSC